MFMIENQRGKFKSLGDMVRGNSTNESGDCWQTEQISEKNYLGKGGGRSVKSKMKMPEKFK